MLCNNQNGCHITSASIFRQQRWSLYLWRHIISRETTRFTRKILQPTQPNLIRHINHSALWKLGWVGWMSIFLVKSENVLPQPYTFCQSASQESTQEARVITQEVSIMKASLRGHKCQNMTENGHFNNKFKNWVYILICTKGIKHVHIFFLCITFFLLN